MAVGPLINPLILKLLKYAQYTLGVVSLTVPERVALLAPTFGPCVMVPERSMVVEDDPVLSTALP